MRLLLWNKVHKLLKTQLSKTKSIVTLFFKTKSPQLSIWCTRREERDENLMYTQITDTTTHKLKQDILAMGLLFWDKVPNCWNHTQHHESLRLFIWDLIPKFQFQPSTPEITLFMGQDSQTFSQTVNHLAKTQNQNLSSGREQRLGSKETAATRRRCRSLKARWRERVGRVGRRQRVGSRGILKSAMWVAAGEVQRQNTVGSDGVSRSCIIRWWRKSVRSE